MSITFAKALTVEDEDSHEIATFTSVPFNEDVDWTDDDQAILLEVKLGRKVFVSRADLRELHGFLGRILLDDDGVVDE